MKTQATFTRFFLAGIAALVLVFSAVVAFGGAAFAQEPLDGAGDTPLTAPLDRGQRGGPADFRGERGPHSDVVDQEALLAEALGISVEELIAAKAAGLAELVEAGVITQEQADQISAMGGQFHQQRGPRGNARFDGPPTGGMQFNAPTGPAFNGGNNF